MSTNLVLAPRGPSLTVVAGRIAFTWRLVRRLAFAATALLLLASGLFLLQGGRALIVRSGSMEPSLGTGSLALSKTVHPSDVRVGDVITFKDSTRDNNLVTHRIIKLTTTNGVYNVTTKGDANTGVEEWSIKADGTIGKLSFGVPKAGYAFAYVTRPQVRFLLVLAAGLVTAVTALHRIWSR
jgi:signal peptidase I